MSERRGVERALSNIFERAYGREPTNDEMQTGLAMMLEGIAQGPPEVKVDTSNPASRSPRMDILEYPLNPVPGIQRWTLGHKWPQPLAVGSRHGGRVLWVALTDHEIDVDLCVLLLPTGTGLGRMDRIALDGYVGSWIDESGTARHIFAWGEALKVWESPS